MVGELRALEELLQDTIGLDSTSVGAQLILRGAKQRMRDLNMINDLAEYERRVRESTVELQELIEEVVVAESWFFRDERPFAWLQDHVRRRPRSAGRPPLRVLSVPCAGGEEPYSIVIALAEAGLSTHDYHVDAVDTSARRLAIARRGVYSRNAFRGPDIPGRLRYFRQHGEHHEIDPAIRAQVQFIQGSILDPRLLEGLPPYDVVFCRNLLIYLVPSARASLMVFLDRVLAPDGVLVIGHADRLPSAGTESGFAPTGDAGCFTYRRKTCGEGSASVVSYSFEPAVLPSAAPPCPARAIEASSIRQQSPVNIEATVSRSPENAKGDTVESATRLNQASALANKGRFSEAIMACEQHLKEKGLSAPAYALMGMICQASGNRGQAEECFRKAVYLDPHHDEALLALALLAEYRGDSLAAANFRRRAERTATLTGKRAT